MGVPRKFRLVLGNLFETNALTCPAINDKKQKFYDIGTRRESDDDVSANVAVVAVLCLVVVVDVDDSLLAGLQLT